MSEIIRIENFEDKLINVDNKPILLAKDVAQLYEVTVSALNQAVKRREDLFPQEFRFQLNEQQINEMVSHSVIPSKSLFGGHSPYVFTEEGLYMLATVLKSNRAKLIHLHIVETFAKLRKISKNLQLIVQTENSKDQQKLIKTSNELLNEVIDADIIEEKKLDSTVKKVKDEFEINLGVIKFKRTIENKG